MVSTAVLNVFPQARYTMFACTCQECTVFCIDKYGSDEICQVARLSLTITPNPETTVRCCFLYNTFEGNVIARKYDSFHRLANANNN
jgi:hypothetical protein